MAMTEIKHDTLRQQLNHYYLKDETNVVEMLLEAAELPADACLRIAETATTLVTRVRETRLRKGGLDAFLYQYDLSSDEGIALMCLAEALLRIPDNPTIDKLIRDKISQADWEEHIGRSDSLFVNATTWGLMLTGKVISTHDTSTGKLYNVLKRLIARGGEPLIRAAVGQAIKVLGKQFVMGRNIREALKRARSFEKKGYLFSYDMLGEAARTADDAERYFQAYQHAIQEVGLATESKDAFTGSGISVKLSALHPRYEFSHHDKAVPLITDKLLQLALQAKKVNIGLTIDAEEADRLNLSLDILAAVFTNAELKDWEGLGFAVQSYQKRAYVLIDWLAELAKSQKRRLTLRLIKGAYWDAEIKNAQIKGLAGYPVFTRKTATDVSFLACAKKILNYGSLFYPAFATHNAYSLAAILEMAGNRRDFEFQCLHGMGYTLYDDIVGGKFNLPCRVYAPVGEHQDLLAYLVRRLLENGANTSFVNRIINEKVPVADIIANPITKLRALSHKPHPAIVLPKDIYGMTRKNAVSINLANSEEVEKLTSACKLYKPQFPLIAVDENDIEKILQRTYEAFPAWDRQPVTARVACLERAADLLEERLPEFIALLTQEAGKTIPDALAEVREAIDFCRYYAQQALLQLAHPHTLPGPTGETNELSLSGRGVIICISPWNFPLAIFTGQITAALVTGNTVIAKPAMQTPHIAIKMVKLLHEAGIPEAVLQLLPVSGKLIGTKVIPDARLRGVIFTGSTETAQQINQTLAKRDGPLLPFIAETGGQNAMIADSSALPEQLVSDIIQSAFMSAGQRCSALRVLFLQEDNADDVIRMLTGAMAELTIGDPSLLMTDIGPVIDKAAQEALEAYVTQLSSKAKLVYRIPLPPNLSPGYFFAPAVFEIKNIKELTKEVFGPVLHIIRFHAAELDNVINAINSTGYGLTLGIHSRINETIQHIQKRARVGNIYVNRNMVGAVVGVQPFGGEGLSGTGPKAGGPHYLWRLCTERTLTVNTTAAGGNTSLMSLSDTAV